MRLSVALLATALVACGAPKPPLVISELEVTEPIPGRHMSAGFFILRNNTAEVINITGVFSPQFARVEIHETTVTDGVSRMRRLDALVVPAHGSVVLERGGKHLMLMQAHEGSDVVTLQFLSAGTPVLSVDYVFPKDN
ncbi:MAG: copper chaperone PCu(A)C [Gammaproteobacteria bacterium]|nr:copper chaperone PCu(A)C [Gammaproteobacteria bacterium]